MSKIITLDPNTKCRYLVKPVYGPTGEVGGVDTTLTTTVESGPSTSALGPTDPLDVVFKAGNNPGATTVFKLVCDAVFPIAGAVPNVTDFVTLIVTPIPGPPHHLDPAQDPDPPTPDP